MTNQLAIPRSHPIFTRKYGVFTVAIDTFANCVGDWIDDRVTGAYVWGPSRIGKSRAVRYFLADILRDRFGSDFPLETYSRSIVHSNAAGFYSDILKALNHRYWDERKSASIKEQLIVDHFVIACRDADTNFTILVIDEAQTMTERELGWLLGLQNALDKEEILFSVIQIGSHQLDYIHNTHSAVGNAHFSARFYIYSARFQGVMSASDVKYVLSGYENDVEWPSGSGISFTDAFGVKRGDLSALSDVLWNEFLTFFPENFYKLGVDYEIPMQHLARTIERLLTACSQGEDWDDIADRKYLNNVIAKTGFQRYLNAISAALMSKAMAKGSRGNW